MALLDVTEVLFSPEFMDTGIQCLRSTQTVDNDGIASNIITATSFSGVVVPTSGEYLQRIPEGERVNGSITIYTTFILRDGLAGNPTDEVIWKGRTYVVSSVQDYGHYGRGFVSAVCDLKTLRG